MADMSAADEELRPLLRRALAVERQRQERALARHPRDPLEGGPADEVGLLHLHRPGRADLRRGRCRSRCPAPTRKCPFSSRRSFSASRPCGRMSHSRPASSRASQSCRTLAPRMMQLDRQLADEADAKGQAGHAGDRDLAHAAVGERCGVDRIVGELRQELAGARTGDVDRAARRRLVGDVHARPQASRPFAQPRLGGIGARRGEGDVEAVLPPERRPGRRRRCSRPRSAAARSGCAPARGRRRGRGRRARGRRPRPARRCDTCRASRRPSG